MPYTSEVFEFCFEEALYDRISMPRTNFHKAKEMHISTFKEFPLSNKAARQIIKEILNSDDSRFFMTRHAIDRMNERGITESQIRNVLLSSSSYVSENTSQTARGDWKLNITGWSAGTVIDVTVALQRVESDPHAFVMTVKIPN